MIIKKSDRTPAIQTGAKGGVGTLTMDKLLVSPQLPEKMSAFNIATLVPGASLGYHTHEGESETYYVISGTGLYNDNGTLVPVEPGDVTYTASGEGHSMENTGDIPLSFVAMIHLD